MDFLSLAANIAAVVSAASTTISEIRKLYSLRHAPDELLQFQNEISDVQVVVAIVQESVGALDHNRPIDTQIKEHVGQLLRRATDLLLSFSNIIHNEMVTRINTTNGAVIKFSWKAWLKNQSRLRKLSAELRATRIEINLALATITVSEAPQARIRLDELSVQKTELTESFRQFESSTTQQITSLSASLGAIRSTLDANRETLLGINAGVGDQDNKSKSPILLQTSLSRPGCARQLCSCRCHKITTRKLPQWLQQVVGFLLIGYSGIPYSSPCNERNCRRENKSLLTVTYYFPRWFWNYCVISFRDIWDPVEGHVISVRTPRIVGAAAPVFHLAQQGNLKGLQDLFSLGLASPFDVESKLGRSVLHHAASHWQIETCAFLLNQYADPYFENPDSMTPIDYLWDHILVGSYTQRSPKALQACSHVFNRFLDPSESLQHRNFTTIHKIVLGLSPINLEAQLETCPDDINSQCTVGRTPLHWAISGGNDEYVQTLLDYGASIHIQDNKGHNPIHRAAMIGTFTSLEKLLVAAASRQETSNISSESTSLKDQVSSSVINPRISYTLSTASPLKLAIEQQDQWGYTPLLCSCAMPSRSSYVKLLLKYSADINGWEHGHKHASSVLIAIQYNRHATIDLLLKWQARVDAKDSEDMGILHVAAASDFKSLMILNRYADLIREAVGIEDKDMYGHTPLQHFDTGRRLSVTEDDEMYLKCRAAFLSLLGLEREEPKDSLEQKFVPQTQAQEINSKPSEDSDSDIFLDVEQDPEGPI